MTLEADDKPFIITDGVVNVLPKLEVKMHILRNAVDFANKIGISRPKVSVLSATEEVIESVPSSIEANLIAKKAKEENINAEFTETAPKVGPRFSRESIRILRGWLSTHHAHPYPTEEEFATLPKVPGHIPWTSWTVAVVEFAERFSYYGTTAVCEYIRTPYLKFR